MFHLNTLPADVFNADGSPGVDPQKINSLQVRVTWQISPKNKLSVYNDRILKDRGAAMTAGFDPATASIVWTSPIYTTGSAKFTSTVTNRILVEGGASFNYERYNQLYQPGIEKVPGTPEWYTAINKQDASTLTNYNAGVNQAGQYPDRFAVATSVSCDRRPQREGRRRTWKGRYKRFRARTATSGRGSRAACVPRGHSQYAAAFQRTT
jgi:hypothetical protein